MMKNYTVGLGQWDSDSGTRTVGLGQLRDLTAVVP
jgi:hypothetical protein